MCVCVCVYVCWCVRVRLPNICVCVYVCAQHIYMSPCVFSIYIYIYIYINTRTHIHTHTHIYIYLYASVMRVKEPDLNSERDCLLFRANALSERDKSISSDRPHLWINGRTLWVRLPWLGNWSTVE